MENITIISMLLLSIVLLSVATSAYFKKQVKPDGRLILLNGKNIIQENLAKARITRTELISILRKANISSLNDVNAVYYHENGDVVVDYRD